MRGLAGGWIRRGSSQFEAASILLTDLVGEANRPADDTRRAILASVSGPAPSAPWRPPSRASRSAHNRRLFVAIAVALVVGTGTLFLFARYASRKPENINLGGRTFVIRESARRAEQAKLGPLFFNDLVRDNRPLPLVLSFLGGTEWAALNAVPPGAAERCAVTWDQARKVFVDPCTNAIFAPDGVADSGGSLTRYSATVNAKDQLEIDLNKTVTSSPASPTSSTP